MMISRRGPSALAPLSWTYMSALPGNIPAGCVGGSVNSETARSALIQRGIVNGAIASGSTLHQAHRRTGFPCHQLDPISATDQSASNDGSIERQLTPKPLDDARQHATVVRQRVRIERGHDAAPAQVLEPDHYLADSQTTTRPVSLLEPMDAADDEIGPQATAVVAKCADSSVRGYQQRQDVKAGGGFVPDQARACADDALDVG